MADRAAVSVGASWDRKVAVGENEWSRYQRRPLSALCRCLRRSPGAFLGVDLVDRVDRSRQFLGDHFRTAITMPSGLPD